MKLQASEAANPKSLQSQNRPRKKNRLSINGLEGSSRTTNAIAAIDMVVVPTVSFDRLFAFLVLCHGRRQLLWIDVTRHAQHHQVVRGVWLADAR